ncbi:hypothetical protein MPH_06002 [Macrophomina phaseolina MS6]|uniref:Uncharacterized protein n=1 Tax=Macrophomina phaseolina (strain MS6) TaxID=1126212 RepID=K2S2Q8_MACPH|nr:hypothetical protein MPH_06002 [Macrophomina phaseolina MS6]
MIPNEHTHPNQPFHCYRKHGSSSAGSRIYVHGSIVFQEPFPDRFILRLPIAMGNSTQAAPVSSISWPRAIKGIFVLGHCVYLARTCRIHGSSPNTPCSGRFRLSDHVERSFGHVSVDMLACICCWVGFVFEDAPSR